MSIFTQIALPTTLTDLLAARDRALELHRLARQLNDAMRDRLNQNGRHLFPHNAEFREDSDQVQHELDRRMWERAFDLTGFKQLMDADAVAEFDRAMHPKPLAFTEGNIRATFIDLHGRADDMFRRGIVNVFRYLSGNYKTNSREPFRVGRKIIMGYMVRPSHRGGLSIGHGRPSDQLNDIDRVIKTLDGKQLKARELESAMNAAFSKLEVFENGYYRARAFKNGNVHLEFLRDDLLEKLNEQIADYYSDGALAHGATR